MKKIIGLIALVMAMVNLMAAAQYKAKPNSSLGSNISSIKQNEGVGVVMGSAGSVFIKKSTALPSNVISFGYYVVGKESIGVNVIDLDNVTENGVFVGNFEAGDKVAFWMQTEDGTYLDSMHNGNKGDDRNAAYIGGNDKNNVEMVIGNGGYGNGYGPAKGDSIGKNDLVLDIIGGDKYNPPPAPVGEPLPGVAVAVTVSAAVGASAVLRKRRQKRLAEAEKL